MTHLPRAAVDDGAFGDGHDRLIGAGGDIDIGIHVRQQREIRIGQLDAHAYRARFLHQVRVDHRDLAVEDAARMGARRHLDRLARLQRADVALGDIGHHPNHRVIGDAEQNIAGLEALAVDGIALEDHAVARRRPVDGIGNLPVALDLFDELLRNTEVEQAPARADHARKVVLQSRGRNSRIAARSGVPLDEKPGGLVEQLLAEHRHQRIALLDVGAAGDRSDLVDEAVEARGNDGDATLIDLDDARRVDGARKRAFAHRLGLDAGALDLAGARP